MDLTTVESWYATAFTLFARHVHEAFAVFVVLVSLLIVVSLTYMMWKAMQQVQRGGTKMSRKEQQQILRQIVADSVTEALEQAIVDDKITPRMAQSMYNLIGKKCNIPDLLPRHRTAKEAAPTIKSRIKERLKGGFYFWKPTIPGDKPPSVVKKKAKDVFRRFAVK